MLDKEEARQIALEVIGQLAKTSDHQLVILEDAVKEYPLVWVFPFNSQQYNASRDFREMLLGIGPIAVKRKTGETRMIRTVHTEEFLKDFLAEDETDTAAPPAH